MRIIVSLIALAALIGIAVLGVHYAKLDFVFGVVIPYTAMVVFLGGFSYRVWGWASKPVPFNITTTSGQQKTLPWIQSQNLENPHNRFGLIGRMALEILLFRSLFRNSRAELTKEGNLAYGSDKTLWLFGLIFHWSFFLVLVRHLRFFTEPLPAFLSVMETMDGLFQIGVPTLYLTDLLLLLGVSFLFVRRVIIPQLRYISLPADYFPLFLILAITITGIMMRYTGGFLAYLGIDGIGDFVRVDIMGVKTLALGLVSFSPTVPAQIGILFYVHLFLVSSLFMYFPFSKLMHMGGIFLSPTRNMLGNTREKRHINPWGGDWKVKVHTYQEYEDDYREMMKKAKLPLEKE